MHQKIPFIVLLVLFVVPYLSNGQSVLDSTSFNPKPLKGYFLFFSEEIINTDPDVTDFKHHQIFYSPFITDSVIMDFTGDMFHDFTAFVGVRSTYGNRLIQSERAYLLNYLKKKYTFQELFDHYPFSEAEKSIPIELVENDTIRYVSIFSGELPVIGPFNGINFKNQYSAGSDLFIYLPSSQFKFKYHYSIVLPYDHTIIRQEYRELLKERMKQKKAPVQGE